MQARGWTGAGVLDGGVSVSKQLSCEPFLICDIKLGFLHCSNKLTLQAVYCSGMPTSKCAPEQVASMLCSGGGGRVGPPGGWRGFTYHLSIH